MEDSLEKNNVSAKWIANSPVHCNYKVNEIYSEAIYEELKPLLDISTDFDRRLVRMDKDFITKLYLRRYFSHFSPRIYDSIGAIVMNCNPFTKGHRYLIEEALKIVDYLIIFVVEENKSTFDFTERFSFVSSGVADLVNMMVVPSGQFILSQITFPEYFLKVVDEDLVKNVEYDITLFAEQIAPALNITYRFVEEEPQDTVTNEYNLAMKSILPSRGIQLIEIPRMKDGKSFISASSVRKCLENNDIEEMKILIPESTNRILFGRMIKGQN